MVRELSFHGVVRWLYIRLVRSWVHRPLWQQRIKLIWFGWGYWPLFSIRTLSLRNRFMILRSFLRVDWAVEHCHTPFEVAILVRELAQRRARAGECFVEAGCWRGGSTAKISLVCRLLGYQLHVYDSFEGVERVADEPETLDFAGQYACQLADVRHNVNRYGCLELCEFHKGWFSKTFQRTQSRSPIRGVFIDCDLAKGTHEVLGGVLSLLADDGFVFSQDYHLVPVRRLLASPDTWRSLGVPAPCITVLDRRLVLLRFNSDGHKMLAVPGTQSYGHA